jgi:hypothetical protein
MIHEVDDPGWIVVETGLQAARIPLLNGVDKRRSWNALYTPLTRLRSGRCSRITMRYPEYNVLIQVNLNGTSGVNP